ncbi:MAG: hypothetical protein WB425_12520 [Terracidiphilus sp.]
MPIPMPKLSHETILMTFIAVTALAMLLQTILLLVISLAVRKAARAMREEAESLRAAIMPVVYDARDFIASSQTVVANAQDFIAGAQGVFHRVAPKIEASVKDLTEITSSLRKQTADIQSSAQEIMERVRKQSDRVDSMFSSLLNTVDRAGEYVTETVSKPMRQISGVLGTVKSIIESLSGPLLRR